MCPRQSATTPGETSPAWPPPLIAPRPARRRLAGANWESWSTSVVLRVTDPSMLERARAAVERELDAIDRACSRFRSDSELARVNASAGRTVRIGPLFAEALTLALRAAELTDGDVDPTIGSALVIAGYDRDWRLLEPPEENRRPENRPSTSPSPRERDPTSRIAMRAVCGWRNLMFDPAAYTVRVPSGFTLDLGATAKAWAADRAAQAAALAGGCGALVGLGGDIATSGPAPARGWQIHVTDDHRSGPTAPGQTVSIRSGGLATSSTAVRRWRHAGKTMHHIIDPATGLPVREVWRTISVAAASCADANIATTAALIRAGAAPAWLAGLGVPARLVSRAGRVYAIGEWPAQAREILPR
jgi:FAD:protein FMN transferase